MRYYLIFPSTSTDDGCEGQFLRHRRNCLSKKIEKKKKETKHHDDDNEELNENAKINFKWKSWFSRRATRGRAGFFDNLNYISTKEKQKERSHLNWRHLITQSS